MANNRMYIRCRRCGAIFCIAKIYYDGYYISNNKDFVNRLSAFYDEHAFCYDDFHEDDILFAEPKFNKEKSKSANYENIFEICYESEIK